MTKVTLPAKGGATSGETVEFEYDSSGMLIGEKSAGMERKFTQQNRFATRELVKNRNGEWEMSAYHTIHGQMLATHISSNSKKAGMNKVSNETGTIFYHTDHLGSVRLITDQNGNIVNSSTTDAYGNPLPHETSQPNTPPGSPKNKGAKMLSNFNFIGTHGIRYVEKVRLHNMRSRWYGNLMIHFLSSDPLLSANLYAYGDLSPIMNIDTDGQQAKSAFMKTYDSGMPFNYNPKAEKIGFGKKPMDSILSVLKKYEILYIAGHGNVVVLSNNGKEMSFYPTQNVNITSTDLKKQTDNIEMKTEIVILAACKSAGGGSTGSIGPLEGDPTSVLSYFAKAFRAGETINPKISANIDKKRIYIGFQSTQGSPAWNFMKVFSNCIFRSADWLWCMKEGAAYAMANQHDATKSEKNPHDYSAFYGITKYDNFGMDFTMLANIVNNKPCRIPAVVAIGVKRGKSVDDLFKKG